MTRKIGSLTLRTHTAALRTKLRSRRGSRFTAMKRYSLCSCKLPADSSKRRRVHSTSSSLALQAFVDVSSQCGLQGVVPRGDEGANGPFFCLTCCSQLEKLSKVKANLCHLTGDVTRKITATATLLGLSAQSGRLLSVQEIRRSPSLSVPSITKTPAARHVLSAKRTRYVRAFLR